MQPDILIRLRKWSSYHVGDQPKMPNDGNWGDVLNADLADAIAEIEYLRSLTGPVTRGGDFASVRSAVKND